MKKPICANIVGLAPAVLLALAISSPAGADKGPPDPKISVHPWVFVGAAGDCGPAAGSDIVAAGWVDNFGLPDLKGKNGKGEDGKGEDEEKKDRSHNDNQGLQLSKNGLTTDCSSAGAEIKGVKGITLTELGFDVRNHLHCGAGAPRFNVVATDSPNPHFLGGCANGTKTANTPQPGWTRVRIDPTNPAQAFPPIPAGAKVVSIDIVFDEGTDTGPDFTGLAILDNIDVNGTLIDKK